jgi:hypothetical protein
MSKLTTQLSSIDETLLAYCAKIEDQNIIMEALKEKSYHEELHINKKRSEDLY